MPPARPPLLQLRLRRWVGPAALALLPLGVYGRFILLGQELANADVFLAYRPAHAWQAEGLRHGVLHLWDARMLGGFPLAFSEYGWFSPVNWVTLFVAGGHAGYYLAVALYVALAGLAAYGLARRWGASRPAALLAGVIFGQSLLVVGGAPLLNQGAAYWTLPALLWAVDAAFEGALLGPPAAGATVALLLLGGHPQMAILCALPAAALAIVRAATMRRVGPLLVLGIACLLGGGVSTVRFLPTLPLVAESTRSAGLTLSASAIGSVTPQALLAGFLLPSLSIPRYLNPQWSTYVGPLPLLLAVWGARAVWRTCRSLGSFLVGLAVLGVLLAFGAYTPLYWLVARTPLLTYFREPSRFLLWTVVALALLAARGLDARISAYRRPRRLPFALATAAWVLLCLGVAGGSGALRVLEPRLRLALELRALGTIRPRDYPVAHYLASADAAWHQLMHGLDPLRPHTFVPLLAVGGALWWWRWRGSAASRAAGAALALSAAPLLLYGQLRLPGIPASVVREQPTAAAIAAQSPPARVFTWLPLATDNELRLQVEATGRNADVASYRLLKHLLTPNVGAQAGVPLLDGYENLLSREQALLLADLGSERAPSTDERALTPLAMGDRRQRIGERWPLASASGVALVLAADSLQPLFWPGSVRYEPALIPGRGDLPALNGFRLVRPLPRAYVVPEWDVALTPEEAVGALLARPRPDESVPTVVTDPAGTLAGRLRRGPSSVPATAGAPSPRFEAQIVEDAERRVVVDTIADSDALLVLLDADLPGWTATVTGAATPIYHANVAFRAVPIPAGRQRVVFTYTPPYWQPALAITAVSTAALLLWLLWSILALGRGASRSNSGPALSFAH